MLGEGLPTARRLSEGLRRGFALPLVLLLVATGAAAAVLLLSESRDSRGLVAAETTKIRERLALESVGDVVLAAFRRKNDPLVDRLTAPDGMLQIDVGGVVVEVRLIRESGKVDLNVAPLPLVGKTLEIVLGSDAGRRALDTVARHREERSPFLDERDVLPADQRFGPPARAVSDAFTIATGAPGIALHHAAPAVRRALADLAGLEGDAAESPEALAAATRVASYIGAELPVYTIVATCPPSGRAFSATLRITPETRTITVLREINRSRN